MPRYIDADKLKNDLLEFTPYALDSSFKNINTNIDMFTVLETLDEQPTADVQEVKHGRWNYESRMFLDTITDDGHIHRRIYDKPVYNQVRICSICGVIISNANEMLMFYCPHCGAKMDKKGGENNESVDCN